MGRGRTAGMEGKPTLAEAKACLRGVGPAGATFASRLGKLIKARNSAGQPDVTLSQDVVAIPEKKVEPSCTNLEFEEELPPEVHVGSRREDVEASLDEYGGKSR